MAIGDLNAVRDRTNQWQAVCVLTASPLVPFDLTSARLVFSASPTPQAQPPTIQKDSASIGGIVITNPTQGLATITLAPADTNVLPDNYANFLYWDLAAIVGTSVYPLANGNLTVQQNVGQL